MSNCYRLAFMGTPDFSVPALHALIAAGHDVACVYSQPPRAKGRGHVLQKSPVHLAADAKNIPVRTPVSLKKPDIQQEFADLNLDVAIVVAYGLILPKAILEAPRMGCLNIHASLLPRWRGAAPIHRAMLAGDAETGVTIMQMDEGLDTGTMLTKKNIPITDDLSVQQLHDQLSVLGASMIVDALAGLAAGSIMPTPQPQDGITYADKLKKEESLISWQEDAVSLRRKVRALNPWPGVSFESHGERIKILEAVVDDRTSAPGTLLDDQLTIACGSKALRLVTVQRPNRGPVDGASFLRGFPVKAGDRF